MHLRRTPIPYTSAAHLAKRFSGGAAAFHCRLAPTPRRLPSLDIDFEIVIEVDMDSP